MQMFALSYFSVLRVCSDRICHCGIHFTHAMHVIPGIHLALKVNFHFLYVTVDFH